MVSYKEVTDQLVKKRIKNSIKLEDSRKYRFYKVATNLWQRVSTKQGRCSWLFRIALHSPAKAGYIFSYITIGEYPSVTLKQAKERAEEYNQMIRAGINPLDARKAEQRHNTTLGQLWQIWITDKNSIKKKTLDGLVSIHKTHIVKLANVPFKSLTKELIFKHIIDDLVNKESYVQAKIVLSKFRELDTFAENNKYIPTRILKDLQPSKEIIEGAKKNYRDRFLQIIEVRDFIIALDKAYHEGLIDIRFHHFIKLTLLIGTRKEELATLHKKNYNSKDKIILLENTKNGSNHWIRLPEQGAALLNELAQIYKDKDYVFSALTQNTPISPRTILFMLNKVEKISGIKEHFTIHDLRRTFFSNLCDLGFSYNLVEKAVNHLPQRTSRHYEHNDLLYPRYKMLQIWADALDKLQETGDIDQFYEYVKLRRNEL